MILSLLMGESHAIVPRGEGTGNSKHPLMKKLGESREFQAYVKKLNGPNLAEEARLRMTARRKEEAQGFQTVFRGDGNISITRPTKAAVLHPLGYQGAGIKIAVIEKEFDPEALLEYAKKGRMDKDALKLNNLPTHDLQNIRLQTLDTQDLIHKRTEAGLQILHAQNDAEKKKCQETYDDVERLIQLKKSYDKTRGKDSHGYPVLEACHRTAPGATLLPIDKEQLLTPEHRSIEKYIKAVQIAIEQGAHVITMSLGFPGWNDHDLELLGKAFEAARKKDIAFFIASGNGSDAAKIDRFTRRPTGNGKSEIAYIAERLNYKGFCPVGATTYKRSTERPSISTFTSMPPENSSFQNIFLLAPGERLYLGNRVINGTSFASPTAAACFALLKNYALRHKIPFQGSHDLMQILIHSGTPVSDHGWGWRWMGPTYNQINLVAACDALDRRLIGQ